MEKTNNYNDFFDISDYKEISGVRRELVFLKTPTSLDTDKKVLPMEGYINHYTIDNQGVKDFITYSYLNQFVEILATNDELVYSNDGSRVEYELMNGVMQIKDVATKGQPIGVFDRFYYAYKYLNVKLYEQVVSYVQRLDALGRFNNYSEKRFHSMSKQVFGRVQ